MKKIILASTSPRRKAILKLTGLPFKAIDSQYDEDMKLKMRPLALAKFLSKGKVRAVAGKYTNHLIIGADTFVVFNNKLLGKPGNVAEAKNMLKKISGRAVEVITGFTVMDSKTKKTISQSEKTKIFIKKITGDEINNYIKTGEPIDKAGAFAVQGYGALIVKKIDGNYWNVVGLPVFSLAKVLRQFNVKIL